MKRWLEMVPTLIWAIVCSVALYVHAEPSEVQDVFVWSWLRLSGLVILAAVTMYCFYSIRRAYLLRINNYLTYLIVVVTAALEVSFRLRPDLIPGEELILHAPKEIRKQYALSRGYMTEEVLASEESNKLIYHFKPNGQLQSYPHVKIDSFGYRNVSSMKGESLDCVLLGDSLTLALDAGEDLGALLTSQGHLARNLAMFGYSPQHYRDVYKRFIVDAKIKHHYVLIFLFAGNDVQDAKNYQRVQSENGDFREYLPQMKSIGTAERYLPIMASVVRGFPRYMKSRLVTNRDRKIALPYTTVSTGELMPPPRVHVGSEEWDLFIKPIGEIVTMARAHGAIPVVFLLPSAATVYAPYDPTLLHYDTYHQKLSEGIRTVLAKESVPFVDMQDRLRTEIQRQFIFAQEKDYHFNTIGVQKVSEEVLAALSLIAKT